MVEQGSYIKVFSEVRQLFLRDTLSPNAESLYPLSIDAGQRAGCASILLLQSAGVCVPLHIRLLPPEKLNCQVTAQVRPQGRRELQCAHKRADHWR